MTCPRVIVLLCLSISALACQANHMSKESVKKLSFENKLTQTAPCYPWAAIDKTDLPRPGDKATITLFSHCDGQRYYLKKSGGTVSGSDKYGTGTSSPLTWSISSKGSYEVWGSVEGKITGFTVTAPVTPPPPTCKGISILVSSGGLTLCSGGSKKLTAYGGRSSNPGYIWYRGGVSANNQVGSGSSYDATLSGTYYVTGKNSCNETKTAAITLSRPPSVSNARFTGGTSLTERCQGGGSSPFTAIATNGSTWEWTITSPNTINANGEVNWASGFSGTATIRYKAFDACGSSLSTTHSVRVYRPGERVNPRFISGTGLTERCQGSGTSQFRASATVAVSQGWSVTSPNTINAQGIVTWSAGFTGTAVIRYTANDACGPASVSHSVQVTPTSNPTVASITGPNNLTLGQSASYSATVQNAGVYSWFVNEVNQNQDNSSLSLSSLASGTYTITCRAYAAFGSCPGRESHDASTTLTVSKPTITILASGKTAFGKGDVQLQATVNPSAPASGSYSYEWQQRFNTAPWTVYRVTTSRTITGLASGEYRARVLWKQGAKTDFSDYSPTANVVGNSYNYIITNTVKEPGAKTIEDVTGASNSTFNHSRRSQQTVYFDGLGRPMQQVVTQGSPDQLDIIQPIYYDVFGRQAVQYLPYSQGNQGLFRPGAQDQQHQFYFNQAGQSGGKIAQDEIPYSENIYEASPLNRLTASYGPGEAWREEEKKISYAYRTNTKDEVRIWTVNATGSEVRSSKFYGQDDGSGELFVVKTTDEEGHHSWSYKNKHDQVILKKVEADGEFLLTYYIYDDYGNLRVVVPPAASAALPALGEASLSDQALTELCFVYHYDERKRMSTKQVPGAEPVYLVYDERDRLVLTQDGNQRNKKQWLFTKYDGLNRPIMTGLYKHPGKAADQVTMQQFANSKNFTERYDGSATTYGYSNTGFPNVTSVPQLFTVTFYDTYAFLSDLEWDEQYNFQDLNADYPEAGLPTAHFDQVRGQATGSITRVLSTKKYLNSVTYYDDRYRPIQTTSQNYLEGFDVVTSAYDFIGQLLHSVRLHSSQKADPLALQERYQYDHAGRLLSVYHQVNQEPEVLMVRNKYNALGELIDKQLHYQGEEDLATYLTATLSASKTYDPSSWQDGALSLPTAKKITIPRVIPVTSGNAGNHELTLTYRDADDSEHTVTYRGGASVSHVYEKDGTNPNAAQLQKAQTYAFYSSSNGTAAGQTVTVSYLKLSVNNGDSWDPAGATGVAWSIDPPASLFVQSVDYRYNIRGWLTSINNSALSDDGQTNNDENDWFGMELFYNQQAAGLSNQVQYNGNISAVKWSHHGPSPEVLGYTYAYDPVNRLTGAKFSNLSNSTRNGTYDVTGPDGKIQYDPNGNIERLIRYGADGTSRTLMDDLSYRYQGNQLLNVDEAASGDFAAQGFKNGTNMGDDYHYDANGNLIEDWNKDIINEIKYNHLNLPQVISFDQGGEIRYFYDATGRKLRKQVVDEDNRWVTDYVDGIQYKKEELQDGENTPKRIDFVMTAEGRIRHTDEESWVYDYDMKDHLGNVRMSITSEATVDTYVATMENKYSKDEEAMFQNIVETRHIYQNANATPAAPKLKNPKASARLNAAQGKDIGPTKSLPVAFGDTVRLSVQAYYENFAEGNGAAVGSALASIVSAFAPAGMIDGQVIQEALSAPEALANMGYKDDDGSGRPAAYLNYMLFDANYVLLNHGFQRVSTAAENQHELLELEVPVGQQGFIYVYVSNQSNWDSNVFFDEFIVEHQHSPVNDNVDYYPFGGLHTQQTDKLNHKYLYNGKELQDELGLNWYDYGARMYDPMVGRFFTQDRFSEDYYSISPFQYAANNPINNIDVNGDWIYVMHEGQNYKYDNGNFYAYNENEGDFSDQSELEDGSFLSVVLKALNKLSSNTVQGNDLVGYFGNGDNNAFISMGQVGSGNSEGYGDISLDPSLSGSDIPTENGIEKSPLWLDLGHELAHTQDYLTNGESVYDVWEPNPSNPDKPFRESEKYATHVENTMRAQYGMPLRTHYANLGIGGYEPTRILNVNGSQSSSKFYNVSLKFQGKEIKSNVPQIYKTLNKKR